MPQPVSASAPTVPTDLKQPRPPVWWAARVVQRWQRRRAFGRAYLEFRATHAHLHELCFDEHFLSGRGRRQWPAATLRRWRGAGRLSTATATKLGGRATFGC